MDARRWTILGAGDLQEMFACLFLGHAELLDRRPVFDAGDGRARSELALHRLTVEPDRHFDVPATVQMQIHARLLEKFEDDDVIFERVFPIFEEDEGVGFKLVLFGEHFFDDGNGMVASRFDVVDFANAVALVVDVESFHLIFPGRCPRGGIALGLHYFDRSPRAEPESRVV